MKQKRSRLAGGVFIFVFAVLTFFCWCPVFYSSYGEVNRIAGVPSWAVWAALFGVVLFVAEWVYLFFSGLAMKDEGLAETIAELSEVDTDDEDSTEEGQ